MKLSKLSLLCMCMISTIVILAIVAPSAFATFPGDNGKIAYSRPIPGGALAIYLTGSGQRTFPSGINNENDFDPAFSPDGSQIAFIRESAPAAGSNFKFYRLMVIQTSGAPNLRAVIDSRAFDSDGDGMVGIGTLMRPAWTADGQRISFHIRGTLGAYDGIWTVGADGSGLSKIPGTEGENTATGFSDWSPATNELLFTCGFRPYPPTPTCS